MNFSDLAIADHGHTIATEGLFDFFKKKIKDSDGAKTHTDSYNTAAQMVAPTTTDDGKGMAFYGNARGYSYPTSKYFDIAEYMWTACPDSFNKNGVSVISSLVSAIEKGYEFTKKHQDEIYKMRQEGRHEEADDLSKQFYAIFKYSTQVNMASKNGNLWSGLPVPVDPKVKAKVITELRKLCKILESTAHIAKNSNVKMAKIKPEYNPAFYWVEVHLYGMDCLSHWRSAVIQ